MLMRNSYLDAAGVFNLYSKRPGETLNTARDLINIGNFDATLTSSGGSAMEKNIKKIRGHLRLSRFVGRGKNSVVKERKYSSS